jgi:hypothetical protein
MSQVVVVVEWREVEAYLDRAIEQEITNLTTATLDHQLAQAQGRLQAWRLLKRLPMAKAATVGPDPTTQARDWWRTLDQLEEVPHV